MAEEFDSDSATSIDHHGETRTDAEIILAAIDSVLRDLHVALPCRITNVRNNSFVDVQVQIQRKYKDGTLVNIPVIQNVPVKNPSGEDWWIKLPIAVGGYGTVLIHERSLDKFIVSGGIVDPEDPRRHDLTDAEFLPGFPRLDKIVPGTADDMVLHNGSAEIFLQKPGTFKITNGTNELFNLLDQLMSQITTLVNDLETVPAGETTAPGSPIAPNPVFVADMVAIGAQLATIQGGLDSLKGS